MNKEIQSSLIEKNDVVLTSTGVWSAKKHDAFLYTDGEASEKYLKDILSGTKDRSSTSLKLEAAIYDWITSYHLSGERANIYRFLNLTDIHNGLELGSGCGAISRYLGEQGIHLDAVEGDRTRAEICRLRCEDLKNVNVIHANFNGLNLPENTYDAVFLNGVLEYARKFLQKTGSDQEAVTAILSQSLHSLSSSGIACIAIENRMGLKYWLGAREDHYGLPHIGLYDYPQGSGIRTYDYGQWQDILAGLGSEYCYRFLFPFPDYKMARAILSDTYISGNDYAHSHLYRVFSTENGNPVQGPMNEFLLWKSLQERKLLAHYANSFFIVIARESERLDKVCPYDFMHFSGMGRRPEYRTLTSKKRHADSVIKEYSGTTPGKNEYIEHDISVASYQPGSLLVSQWIESLVMADATTFEKCVREYYNFLVSSWENVEERQSSFDMLPFNIIVDDSGKWQVIDTEWLVSLPLSPEYLLFRALFWFPAGNEALLAPYLARYTLANRKEFINHYFNLLSLSFDDGIEQFIANEELIQSRISVQIRENPVQNTLIQPLRQTVDRDHGHNFVAQLYWRSEEETWSEDKSAFTQGRAGEESQTISFKLPPIGKNISSLRFDPADRPGFFRLESLSIRPQEDEHSSEVFMVAGIGKIAGMSSLANIVYSKNGLGELFVSLTNDPFLVIDLPEEVIGWYRDTGIIFSVVMDWPKSTDYIIAMDSLGKKVVELEKKILTQDVELTRLNTLDVHCQTQAQRISQQAERLKEASDKVRAKDIYIENIEREIEAMRQTRVWKVAEILRKKIYFRLLDGKTLMQKSLKTLRQEGFRQFFRKIRQHLSTTPDAATLGFTRADYDLWVEHNRLTEYDIEEIRRGIREFGVQPLFSIVVPVYNVDQEWLERTIDSVRRQLYENWELCICDDLSPSPHVRKVLQQYADLDSRIKVLFKERNEGIAITSNAALSLASGDYIGLLDHDDEISSDALFENARVINANPGVGLIYSDEDKFDMQGRRCDPFFKPDYSPELIKSQNYICHFTVIKKSIVDELHGFRRGYDGSQDHDLILRALEKTTKVHHIPKVLYHWRKIPGSTAAVYDSKSYAWEAGRKAVADSLTRMGIEATVSLARFQGSYRVRKIIEGTPLVTIIIPFKDKGELLRTVVTSILEKSTCQHYEILGISNNSEEEQTRQVMNTLCARDKRVRFVDYNIPFNFSAINNHAVGLAAGEYVVLLNNDIEIISPEWLQALLEIAQLPGVGAVGGKLYYPDNRIQHAGIVIGMAGVAGPPHYLFYKDDVGYYARAHVIHNVSAVTGACLMVSKRLYNAVGGMDSEHFGVAYNDIDFCLKLQQKGYRNVFTPYCEMYHYESQSRGYEDTPEKKERLQRESGVFRERWKDYFINGDPYYSPHLSLEKTNFTIKIN